MQLNVEIGIECKDLFCVNINVICKQLQLIVYTKYISGIII